eukprot:12126263-Prorocentrum_lima.AAC.1
MWDCGVGALRPTPQDRGWPSGPRASGPLVWLRRILARTSGWHPQAQLVMMVSFYINVGPRLALHVSLLALHRPRATKRSLE